ncbi:hypothetical protein CEXT_289521 [Caerostris extrusa]|uniref:Uncharacterized protein n=1 Tax=Caerostris extrusa TaxID=172846 RepID=A0AAV4PV66_CAEEX|nr:hypothetical protein CEXT_289521 [Caerostris extrusa]
MRGRTQLATCKKYRPENFTKWKNLRVFQNICEEDPQNLDKKNSFGLLVSLEDLQEAIHEGSHVTGGCRKVICYSIFWYKLANYFESYF